MPAPLKNNFAAKPASEKIDTQATLYVYCSKSLKTRVLKAASSQSVSEYVRTILEKHVPEITPVLKNKPVNEALQTAVERPFPKLTREELKTMSAVAKKAARKPRKRK